MIGVSERILFVNSLTGIHSDDTQQYYFDQSSAFCIKPMLETCLQGTVLPIAVTFF